MDLTGKTILSRYRVEKYLGSGGITQDYWVWDKQIQIDLVMRVLPEKLATDRIFLRSFQREVQQLADLRHPNLVRFYGLGQDGRLAFMLTELFEGESLKLKIFDAGAPFSFQQVQVILNPVLNALQYLHKQRMQHGGVEPEGIVINPGGHVKLASLDMARLAKVITITLGATHNPAYMAPEQARRMDDLTIQTDVYALGVILFELLSGGERPFTGEHAEIKGDIIEKILWEQIFLEPPSVSSLNSEITSAVEAVVFRCLEKNPSDRYQNPIKLWTALENAFEGQGDRGDVPKLLPDKPGITYNELGIEFPEKETRPENSEAGDKVSKLNKFPLWGWIAALGIFFVLSLTILFGRGVERVGPLAWVATEMTPANTSILSNTPTLNATAPPTFRIGSTQVSAIDGMVQVYVPAGEFEMGSENGNENERPVHLVYLDAYWMDQTEVTNEMYARCVQAGICTAPRPSNSSHRPKYYGHPIYDDYPAINVSWNDAVDYCEWADRRLPTEAEWEKAARGGLGGKEYPWGDEYPVCEPGATNSARYDDSLGCDNTDTIRVGTYGANGYGLYDMAGNVGEFVVDWYAEDYYKNSPTNNPQGPASGNFRVIRGGSWGFDVKGLRSAYRNKISTSWNYLGFRCSDDVTH